MLRFSSTSELIGEEDGEGPVPIDDNLAMGRCSRLKLISRASRPVEDDDALSEGKEVMWLCDRSMASNRSLREDTTCCAAEESSRW